MKTVLNLSGYGREYLYTIGWIFCCLCQNCKWKSQISMRNSSILYFIIFIILCGSVCVTAQEEDKLEFMVVLVQRHCNSVRWGYLFVDPLSMQFTPFPQCFWFVLSIYKFSSAKLLREYQSFCTSIKKKKNFVVCWKVSIHF